MNRESIYDVCLSLFDHNTKLLWIYGYMELYRKSDIQVDTFNIPSSASIVWEIKIMRPNYYFHTLPCQPMIVKISS